MPSTDSAQPPSSSPQHLLRDWEDDKILWLEAPNRFVAEWVQKYLPAIESLMRPHTQLKIRLRLGWKDTGSYIL
jgi:hypothetical protein